MSVPTVICPAGTIHFEHGLSFHPNDCQPCPGGTYNEDAGTNSQYHDDLGDCSNCEIGKYLETK